jgi:AcrR family transcriptional regulator
MATAKPRRAPRTAPEVRREQLVAAAMPQFAAQGYAGVQLQAIADAVGVTRNLIHRYFPGGKRDLYVEAVRQACADLAELLDVDPDVPLEEKTSANIATYVDAILEQNPIYVLYSRAGHSADDDIRAFAMVMRDTLVSRIALNNLGSPDPPATVRAALDGYIAFVEATCESWRDRGLGDRPALERVLGGVFASVIAAAQPA